MNRHDLINKLNSLKIGTQLLKKELTKEKKEKIINAMEEAINEILNTLKQKK